MDWMKANPLDPGGDKGQVFTAAELERAGFAFLDFAKVFNPVF